MIINQEKSVRVSNDPIPKQLFSQWHEILVATGGRYLGTPRAIGSDIRVDYEPGDYAEQCRRWRVVTMPIREVRRDQWWRRLMRRFSF